MTDLGASLGLSALKHSDEIILHRNRLLRIYQEYLRNIPVHNILLASLHPIRMNMCMLHGYALFL